MGLDEAVCTALKQWSAERSYCSLMIGRSWQVDESLEGQEGRGGVSPMQGSSHAGQP